MFISKKNNRQKVSQKIYFNNYYFLNSKNTNLTSKLLIFIKLQLKNQK